eukprot:CAMPEP_0181340650 /NCGR_PEP_ID=MMETSP1101-20121128/29965_1 /TAXON_ID=46948 /ORGANISM="Rhodomonas abbreviata, Strain Caron Lab Isolate" /LENGTH=55 /DNA_ID=CAMNT_0023451825 /DNA_START=62 /DNA_END=229 /DNA_ORIENTATION=-
MLQSPPLDGLEQPQGVNEDWDGKVRLVHRVSTVSASQTQPQPEQEKLPAQDKTPW